MPSGDQRPCRFGGKPDIDRNAAAVTGVAFDAVDGAHSAASKWHRVVASKRTTLRGAVQNIVGGAMLVF